MRRSWVLAVVAATLVVSVGSVIAAPATAPDPLPITIGYQATADWLLLVKELKLFEKNGLAPTT
jgi:ABC-type nitrate/sulfonate/bicarbonate transport system substrate-binding protein